MEKIYNADANLERNRLGEELSRNVSEQSGTRTGGWGRWAAAAICVLMAMFGQRASGAQPQQGANILYYVDDAIGTDQMLAALVELSGSGDTYTVASSYSDFVSQLQGGSYQVAILFVQSNSPDSTSVNALGTFVAGGGTAIYCDWTENAGLAAQFGAQYGGNNNQSQFVVTAAALEAGLTADTVNLTNPGWGIFAMGESAISGAQSAAVFGDNSSAIVIGNGGKSIVNGFLSDTPNSPTIYINEINYLLGNVGPLPPVTPTETVLWTGTAPVTIDVLANDTDPEGTPLTLTAVTPPSLGQAVISGSTVVYTPNINFKSFAGTDTFTYTVVDGLGLSSTGSVIIGNPFYLEKGNYAGMLGNAGGYLTLTASGIGAFTGKLRLGTTSYSLKGSFSTSGTYSGVVGGETLTLQMDLTQFAGDATGDYSITGSYNGVPFVVYHALYNSSTDPAPQVGKYTVIIQPPAAVATSPASASVTVAGGKITGMSVVNLGTGYISVPPVTFASTSGSGTGASATAIIADGQVVGFKITGKGSGYPETGVTATVAPPSGMPLGFGYATLNVNESGNVSISGKLADGTSFSDGVVITGGTTPLVNQFPVYINLSYKAPGSLIGTVTFENIPNESDCDGVLAWTKPPQTSGVLYTGGISTTLSAIGSRYAKPPAGVLALTLTGTSAPNASVTLNESDWANPITHLVTVGPGATPSSNTVTVAMTGSDALQMSINAGSGSFSGSFLNPSTNKTTSIGGVLFRKQTMAGGFFLTPTESGAVSLTGTGE